MFFWKRSLTNKKPSNTHFPHSFRMPFWFFLCSGETGDCWPDSTPDDMGERSDRVESSVFSAFPVNRKSFTYSVMCLCFYKFNIGLNTHYSIFTHQVQTDHAFPVALHQILAMQESRGKESKDLCHNAAELIFIFTSMELVFKLREDDIKIIITSVKIK